jgi:type I restriction enzyme S subunit
MNDVQNNNSNEWNLFPLSELVDCLDGQRRPVKKEDRENIVGMYPYYGASGIIDFVNDYIFDGDYILLGEDGENVISRNLPLAFKIRGKNWVNNHAHVLKPKNNFDINYLVYILESRDFKDIVSGSAQPKINQKNLMRLEFLVPEINQQQKIAKILTTCDKLIVQTQSAIIKYKAIKQGMLHDLFTRGLDDNGMLRPAFQQTPELYKESELGMIPKEWEVERFGDFVDLIHGYQFRDYDFTEFGTPLVKIGQIKPENVDLSKCSYVSKDRIESFKSIIIRNGDVLMALTGATLGKTCQVKGLKEEVLQNYRVGRFEPKNQDEIHKGFLYYTLTTQQFLNQVFSKVNAGAQGNIGKTDFEKPKFKRPPFNEQIMIFRRLESLNHKLKAEEILLSKYQNIKQGLMVDLLSGKKGV